jgi:hypothetical protein
MMHGNHHCLVVSSPTLIAWFTTMIAARVQVLPVPQWLATPVSGEESEYFPAPEASLDIGGQGA